MTEHAVALVNRPLEPASATAERPPAERPATTPSPTGGRGRRSRRLGGGRSYLLLATGIVLSVWLVLVFGRALTQLNDVNDRAAAVRRDTAALQARLAAAEREVEVVQTDAFVSMQARSYGMGRPGERAFALASGAPPPPPVVPLGSETGTPPASSPLEAWLRLLFGD